MEVQSNMAKEITTKKSLNIPKPQQYMLLAVLGTSIALGVAIALIAKFSSQISLNTRVIMEEEKSIVQYSDLIKNIGICKQPSGPIYSDQELDSCKPEDISVSEIPGTLRAEIIENLAANESLNSVPKEDSSSCLDENGEPYTYKKLIEQYDQARGAEQLQIATNRIRSCSALRVIPDALPSFRNEEALLASLNKLYLIAGWEPESISSSGAMASSELVPGLNEIMVNSTIEADPGTTMAALNNIERSIREFDIRAADIEWNTDSTLSFRFEAAAYYMDESKVLEKDEPVRKEGK